MDNISIPVEQFYPYISYIRFPFYKKLAHNIQIDFKYPITAIVGENGTSKSSILRAVYSAPEGKSISHYWFETKIDSISDIDTTTHIPKSAFIYGYYNTKASKIVEVIKTRVNRTNKPDYWEPARPKVEYGMTPLSNDEKDLSGLETRWPALKKNVLYLDFRHEAVSAFDKYFYHGVLRETKRTSTKQDFIRRRSLRLQNIINNNIQSYSFYGAQRLRRNIQLNVSYVNEISKILERTYSSIRVIEHALFTDDFEKTIYLSTNDLKYSEAFAGSGEFAVVSLVQAVLDAPEKSLIILDEPEVSLHPAAQEKLLNFIAKQVIIKKHQVVFATHSPTLIKPLPQNAIKLLTAAPDGTVNVSQDILPEEAFFSIGWKPDKKTIIVEDIFAKCVIEHILKKNNMYFLIDVKISPNGAESIKKVSILNSALFTDEKNTLYILDGDKKFCAHRNPDDIPISENNTLDAIIRRQTGCTIPSLHPSDNET